jgi:putative sterol carrier protein
MLKTFLKSEPVTETNQMEIKTPAEFFEKTLPAKFDPKKAAGFDAIVQVSLSGPNGGDWTVTIRDQKLNIEKSVHPSPTITIMMADADYVDMINGKLSGERAFMTGRLKFKGSMSTALKLISIGFM